MKFNGRCLLLAVLVVGCGSGEGFDEKSAESLPNEDTESLMSALSDSYPYRSKCPSPNGGRGVVDNWQFYECECVSYAAYKLNQRGVNFQNSYKGARFGNASNWKNAAKQANIPVSSKAKAGDIAWFSPNHVAYVESVNSDGSVNVSEYNWSPHRHDYGTRSKVRADAYIHF